MKKKRVVIIGGGFVGISAALRLVQASRKDLHIRIVSDRPNFEYHGALYRLVLGGSPLEVCLPLCNIFSQGSVEVVVDRVHGINKHTQVVLGESGSQYRYDYLIVGVGSETNYFNIEGLEEHAMGMQSLPQALALHRHITTVVAQCPDQTCLERARALRFVIVGAGATGVEIAGGLAAYLRQLSTEQGINVSDAEVHLVERSERVLPLLREEISQKVHKRLEKLKVSVECGTSIESFDGTRVVLSGGTVECPTVIWTAGVRANRLLDNCGFEQARTGRVMVDEYLRAHGYTNIYIGGDSAETKYAGMATTAMADGAYIAEAIMESLEGRKSKIREQVEPPYAIPVGPNWAAVQWHNRTYTGKLGWLLRRYFDWKVFYRLLPLSQAWAAFRAHYRKS